MKISLTEADIATLKRLHKSQKLRTYADRIKFILYLHRGFTQKEAADLLLFDEDTATLWKHRFLDRVSLDTWFVDCYKAANLGNLSFCQMSEVRAYVHSKFVGSSVEIRKFIVDTFSVTYSASGACKLLQRINLSHKQLTQLPGKISHAQQAPFIEKYTKILAELTENQEIVFIDAVHPQHNTTTAKVWTEKGVCRYIPSNTGRDRLNINGAYNPYTADIICHTAETINAESTIELLEQISAFYPNKTEIFVYADNARSNKCKAIAAWLQTQTKIQLRYLPPYSPNLNFIERLWKLMRKTVIHTHFYQTFKEFEDAIDHFFDAAPTMKDTIAQFIGTKFNTLTI